jgi:hypothetical protein
MRPKAMLSRRFERRTINQMSHDSYHPGSPRGTACRQARWRWTAQRHAPS